VTIGSAQQLFCERTGKEITTHHRWPLLDRAREEGFFASVDLILAEHLATSEEVAAFLCYLSLCSRRGHLCVKWEDGDLLPPLTSCCPLKELEPLIIAGCMSFPDNIEAVSTFQTDKGTLFYFQKNWVYETQVWEQFSRLVKGTPVINVEQVAIDDHLLPEQAQAIRSVCQGGLTIITGGPGTGKTYTAGKLLHYFLMGVNEEQRDHLVIALAAPTGKAAGHLEANLSHGLQVKSGTLHALLEIGMSGQRRRSASTYLEADLVLVDESSMIDVRLMGQLLSAIKPGARLVLLGDKDQLPSVEAGSIFHDLILACRREEGGDVVELSQCMRAERKELIEIAKATRDGDSSAVIQQLLHSGIGWKKEWNTEELIKLAIDAYPKVYTEEFDPETMLKEFQCFRILCPLRQGLFGVDRINALCLEESLRRDITVAPIIITRTDHQLGLYNGEVGLLVKGRYAYFPERVGTENVRRLSVALLPRYEYAYCLTVHKSQGSEFEQVLLLLPEGSEVFGREIFYTAITRAKKKLEIWGKEPTLMNTLSQESLRLSGIADRHHMQKIGC